MTEKVSRGTYNSYTPQKRAKIGKYAAENGPMRAAKHFTATWGIHVNESTARRLKSEYLKKLKEVVSEVKLAVGEESKTAVNSPNILRIRLFSNEAAPYRQIKMAPISISVLSPNIRLANYSAYTVYGLL